LICNAHLDPVWLWEWEEGAAEALATFRTAADLCEEFEAFVFCHNEALLYQHIEALEPALFKRIQELVSRGQWHIMGGWFLQPDCNMPSGESFLRQIQLGRRYFEEKFGVRPTTAINFDSFGHTRGLVQILKQCGYDSYLFCRPLQGMHVAWASNQFWWEGFDGSRVLASRAMEWYNSPLGRAREKVENVVEAVGGQSARPMPAVGNASRGAAARTVPDVFHVLWGVGNHGGGPSRKDLRDLAALMREHGATIMHSTPERYFADLRASSATLPVHADDMNPWGVGCYISQVRIKQLHRRLENELYATEKLTAAAALSGFHWPEEALQSAMRDLCLAEFHDILPGSSIQPVEEQGIRILQHGLEELSRVRNAAFVFLAQGERAAREGEIPVLVANPHPFPVEATVACEFNLPDQNYGNDWTVPDVYAGRHRVPSQVEQELSNLNLDWRKRVVFRATLKPSGVTRFDCRLRRAPTKRTPFDGTMDRREVALAAEGTEVAIDRRSGLMKRLVVNGTPILAPRAFQPVVMEDSADPWGMRVTSFMKRAGLFKRLSSEEAARFAGVAVPRLAPVRVIEHGDVRTVIESLMAYEKSRLVMRLAVPRTGGEVAVDVRVFWHEQDRLLKLRLPWDPALGAPRFRGQTAFGVQEHPLDGSEVAALKWVALEFPERDLALTVVNDGTYAFSADRRALYLTLLHSPAYAAHPIADRHLLAPDRFHPRSDQGERQFRFWLKVGPASARMAHVSREADAHNEKPSAVSFFPSGEGIHPAKPGLRLTGRTVQLSALRKVPGEEAYIARVFNPLPRRASCELVLEALGVRERIALDAMVFRTYRIERGRMTEVPPDIR